MRAGALVIGLAVGLSACGGRAPGPAWPTAAATDEDGGESLAPRETAVAAIEAADEPAVETAPAVAITAEAAAVVAPDEATPPTTITAPEEVIDLDDIVIEIEEE